MKPSKNLQKSLFLCLDKKSDCTGEFAGRYSHVVINSNTVFLNTESCSQHEIITSINHNYFELNFKKFEFSPSERSLSQIWEGASGERRGRWWDVYEWARKTVFGGVENTMFFVKKHSVFWVYQIH